MIPKIKDLQSNTNNEEKNVAQKFYDENREDLLNEIGEKILEHSSEGFIVFNTVDYVQSKNGRGFESIFPSFEKDAREFLKNFGNSLPDEVRKAYENKIKPELDSSFTKKDFFDLANLIKADEELAEYFVVPASNGVSIIWDKKAATHALTNAASDVFQEKAKKVSDLLTDGQNKLKKQVKDMHETLKKSYDEKPAQKEPQDNPKPDEKEANVHPVDENKNKENRTLLGDLLKSNGIDIEFPDFSKKEDDKPKPESKKAPEKETTEPSLSDLKKALEKLIEEQKNGKDKQ